MLHARSPRCSALATPIGGCRRGVRSCDCQVCHRRAIVGAEQERPVAGRRAGVPRGSRARKPIGDAGAAIARFRRIHALVRNEASSICEFCDAPSCRGAPSARSSSSRRSSWLLRVASCGVFIALLGSRLRVHGVRRHRRRARDGIAGCGSGLIRTRQRRLIGSQWLRNAHGSSRLRLSLDQLVVATRNARHESSRRRRHLIVAVLGGAQHEVWIVARRALRNFMVLRRTTVCRVGEPVAANRLIKVRSSAASGNVSSRNTRVTDRPTPENRSGGAGSVQPRSREVVRGCAARRTVAEEAHRGRAGGCEGEMSDSPR